LEVKYTVVVHPAGESWNAYVPDLDGVVATAATRDRVIELIAEAIPFHLSQLAESGDPTPEPRAEAVIIECA
jgi:predicted RNase H-like HicB family nuclease